MAVHNYFADEQDIELTSKTAPTDEALMTLEKAVYILDERFSDLIGVLSPYLSANQRPTLHETVDEGDNARAPIVRRVEVSSDKLFELARTVDSIIYRLTN